MRCPYRHTKLPSPLCAASENVSSCERQTAGGEGGSVVFSGTTGHTFEAVPGPAGLPRRYLWAAVPQACPSLPPSPLPAVDGSGQPSGKSGWVRGVKWKQTEKGGVQMTRVSGQEVVTSDHGQWIVKRLSPQLWASLATPRGHSPLLRTLPVVMGQSSVTSPLQELL